MQNQNWKTITHRTRQELFPTIFLHSRHPWRSEVQALKTLAALMGQALPRSTGRARAAIIYVAVMYCALFILPVQAGQITYPDNSYTSGDTLTATDLNAKFNEVKADVNDNDGRITVNIGDITALQSVVTAMQATITSLQTTVSTLQTDRDDMGDIIVDLQIGLLMTNGNVTALQTAMAEKSDTGHNHDASYSALSHDHAGVYAPVSHDHAQGDITGLSSALGTHTSQISAINSSDIMALDPYVTVKTDSRGPIATFSGLNLQLVNGTGTTDGIPNGLGNFIIGYDVVRNAVTYFCSFGLYTDQTTCEANSYLWAVSHKTGSHYLVIGNQNNYSQYGGLVVGLGNTSNRGFASVSGGNHNTASGLGASVSGGNFNTASGYTASVSGGAGNTASGGNTSVSGGGQGNIASGLYASVSGGISNTASGDFASVSGGYYSTASGNFASVSGGAYSIASGAAASVSGGGAFTAPGGNTASHDYSSILGGVSQSSIAAGSTIPVLP